jgi:hypothetical protein
MSRTDLEILSFVTLRVHGSRMVDTYVEATRFTVDGDDRVVHYAIDGDAAEELLFSVIRWHHAEKLIAKYEWYEALSGFVTVLQRPRRHEYDDVDLDHWQPDADLAVLDRAEAPGVGHEFWLDDFPVSASFTVVPREEFDQAMRPVSNG